MANLFERIEQLGGMIKAADVDLLKEQVGKPRLAELKNGSSLNMPAPQKKQTGVKPLFSHKMNDNSPYAKT